MSVLSEQYVLITGSSRGIGAGIACELASQGATVAITYTRNKEQAQKTYQQLKKPSVKEKKHLLLQIDVCCPQSIKQAVDQCVQAWGCITALINNAGVTKDGLLLRMTDEDFDKVLKTNLYGAFYCAREVTKYIIKSKKKLNEQVALHGGIVNISSVVGAMGNAGQVNYVASKAGLEGLTRSLARELACRNIRVNAVAPGFIKTRMVESLNDKQVEAIQQHIPLKKLGEVKDVAQTVSFLLSANYITGQVIAVNGGLIM